MKNFEVGSVLSPEDYHTNNHADYNEWAALAVVTVLGIVTLAFIVSKLGESVH